MSWVPIYIRGKKGFKDAVAAKREVTWLRGSTDGEVDLAMFWLRQGDDLVDLKRAIGSKLIFKFRIHFITDLDVHLAHLNKTPTFFSDAEKELILNATRAQELIRENRSARFAR
ncbi:MAG: hypothetical protein MUC38_15745 [Cyclobacteriaceae bacterium]|jgi:hypothetical protein|nr:hypothetical protein [Cyclobacteriaceae bacterium]